MQSLTEFDLVRIWFYGARHFGARERELLLNAFGDVENIFDASEKKLSAYMNEKQKNELLRNRNIGRLAEHMELLTEKGISVIHYEHESYPKKLKHIYNPPGVLYVKGRLIDEINNYNSCIGIVGSRNYSMYGKEMAYYFARELAKEGLIIVSGLAMGVDGQAHRGALTAGGYTMGVLGCGINMIYPMRNAELFYEMEQSGAIISEYDLDEKPMPYNFPQRNRIISGLTDGLLVVEAGRKSGSLITAGLSLDEGRQVFAVPGRISDINSVGTNELIREGAVCVTSPEDILMELSKNSEVKNCADIQISLAEHIKMSQNQNENTLAPAEKMVYSCLSLEPTYIDDIVCATGYSVREVISALYALEHRELVKQVVNGYYILTM